jgi:hypothetical protein
MTILVNGRAAPDRSESSSSGSGGRACPVAHRHGGADRPRRHGAQLSAILGSTLLIGVARQGPQPDASTAAPRPARARGRGRRSSTTTTRPHADLS